MDSPGLTLTLLPRFCNVRLIMKSYYLPTLGTYVLLYLTTLTSRGKDVVHQTGRCNPIG